MRQVALRPIAIAAKDEKLSLIPASGQQQLGRGDRKTYGLSHASGLVLPRPASSR